jgi:hypothetical protein
MYHYFEPISNATLVTPLQSQKLLSPKTTTEDGKVLDFNPLPQNAHASIRSNREQLSNITDVSELH